MRNLPRVTSVPPSTPTIITMGGLEMRSGNMPAWIFTGICAILSACLFAAEGTSVTIKETDSSPRDGIKAFKTNSEFAGTNSPAGDTITMTGPGSGTVDFSNAAKTAFGGATGGSPSKNIQDTHVEVTFKIAGEPAPTSDDDCMTVVDIKGTLVARLVGDANLHGDILLEGVYPNLLAGNPPRPVVVSEMKASSANKHVNIENEESVPATDPELNLTWRKTWSITVDRYPAYCTIKAKITYLGLDFNATARVIRVVPYSPVGPSPLPVQGQPVRFR